MRQILMSLALIAFSFSAQAAANDGTYKGHGHWQDPGGEKGDYQVETTVKSGVIKNVYTFGGQSKSFTMEAPFGQKGFFPVKVEGQKAGSGYCFEVQCHYVLESSSLEETVVFVNGHLYRTGSKNTENGKPVAWQENLELVK